MSAAILPGIYPLNEEREFLPLKPAVTHPDSIPVEILCKIFESCVDQVSDEDHEAERVSWIRITHVCRYWREVALDHACLWSNISFIHPGLAKAMLTRSKSTPLVIRFRTSEEAPRPTLGLALSQARRLRIIELMPGPDTQSDLNFAWVLRKIGTTAPILEELTMWNYFRVVDRRSFPKALLAGFVPALRRMELREMDIPWSDTTVCWPTRLTHLKLSFCRSGSLAGIFRAMSEMTALEVIHLHRCLPELSQPTTWPTSIKLPRLSTVTLVDPPSTVGAFFSGLKLPRIALISLSFTETLQSEVISCLTKVKESMTFVRVGTERGTPTITSLEMGHIRRRREFLRDIEWCNTTEMAFEPTSHDDEVDIATLSPPYTPPRIQLSFASQDVPLHRLLTLIDDAFSLTRLVTLHLIAADKRLDSSQSEQLFSAFSRCPVLQEIRFTETPVTHFLAILGGSKVDSPIIPGQVTLFPVLARLSFCRLDWKTAGWSMGLLSRGLAKALNARPLNHRLQQLKFTQCAVTSPLDIKSLRSSLPGVAVEWDDGIENNISQPLPSAAA